MNHEIPVKDVEIPKINGKDGQDVIPSCNPSNHGPVCFRCETKMVFFFKLGDDLTACGSRTKAG